MRPPSLHHLLLLSCALLAAFSHKALAADSDIVTTLTELATEAKGCSQKADIFFALDSSHSVGRSNFDLVRKFIHEIVSKLVSKSSNFRFGIVVFSDKADMVIKLKDYSVSKPVEKVALLNFLLHDVTYKSGKTVTGEAFQLIREQGFLVENGHRPDAQPVVVLLTDGRANGRADPIKESEKLRAGSIKASIVALGVGSGISRAALEKLASRKEYVTIVNDFEDLGKVSRLITDVLCQGGKASSVTTLSKLSCGLGLQVIAGVCVPVKPKCRLMCPKGFLLVFPCKCIPDVSVSDDCIKTCRESEILVRGCVCVPRHVSSKPLKPKVCNKTCSPLQVLNKINCECECRTKCSGINFSQAKDCTCSCSMRCRSGLALNKDKCECQRIDCKPRYEFFEGKCQPIVRKFCPAGQVLFRDICKRGDECPEGYKLRSDRKCYKVSCDPGLKKTKSGQCEKVCPGKKYFFNNQCNEPAKCSEHHQYFKVNAPGCPRTCEEPVPLVKCPKERSPQCVCQPYFLLHNGKCIHPSDCPNIPICIQKADVVFMLDSSLTVTEHNFYMMKNFVRDVVQQFYLHDGTRQRVGVMRFNHNSDIIMDLDSWEHNTHEEIQKKIEAIEYQPGLTFLGEALHTVRTKMWKRRAGMRDDVPHVTLLITDGTETNGQIDQYWEAKQLRDSGVFFVTIAMGDQIGVGDARRSLEKLAGPEGRVFIFGLREFQDIHGLVARVLTFHCEKPLCPRSYLVYEKCINDYKSISRVEYVSQDFQCKKTIQRDFKKIRCACPKPDFKDSPCIKMFKTVTHSVYTLDKKQGICTTTFKDTKVRCSCPSDKVVEGDCKNYKRTITKTAYTLVQGGALGESFCKAKTTTKTLKCASGYATIKYTMFDEPALLKEILSKEVENVTKAMSVSLAKSLKLHPYQVANMKLDPISLNGSFKAPYKALHPFAVLAKKNEYFFMFKDSKFKFKPKTVKVFLPECPKPIRKVQRCVNNFRLVRETLFKFEHKSLSCAKVQRTKEVRCSCPKPEVETAHCNGEIVPIKVYEQRVNKRNQCDEILWTGSVSCSRQCSKRMDVAFIVDSSDSVRGANFEYMRRFIVAVAKKLDVSRDNSHIAVLKYSSVENMKVIFNFVSHYHFHSMKTRVMEMRYSPGSTYTGDALLCFRRFLLNKVNGYRGGSGSGIDSVVILITDGASNSVIDPIKEARKIKAMGSTVITIGVGDDVRVNQLRKISSEPAEIYSFKTDSFRDLPDPVFVNSVLTATCSMGKINNVSVKQSWTNKLRDMAARKVDISFADLGLKRFNVTDVGMFEFKLKGKYSSLVGSSQSAKSAFLTRVRDALSARLEVHPFSIRKLQVSRQLAISGQIYIDKIDKLKSLIEAKKLNLGAQVKIDATSFVILSPESLKVARIASRAADTVFGIVRPLSRLLVAAKNCIRHITRKDARILAEKEVEKLSQLVEKCETSADELTELSAKARKTADKAAANECVKKLRFVLNSAKRVARQAMYIAYFSPKDDRDTIVRRHDKVAERISRQLKGLKLPKVKPEKPEPKAKGAATKAAATKAVETKTVAKKSLVTKAVSTAEKAVATASKLVAAATKAVATAVKAVPTKPVPTRTVLTKSVLTKPVPTKTVLAKPAVKKLP